MIETAVILAGCAIVIVVAAGPLERLGDWVKGNMRKRGL